MHDAALHDAIAVQTVVHTGAGCDVLVRLRRSECILVLFAGGEAQGLKNLTPVELVPAHLKIRDHQPAQRFFPGKHLVCNAVLCAGQNVPGFVDAQAAANGDLRICGHSGGVQFFQKLRGHAVVRIHKSKPAAAGDLQPGVAGAAQALVGLMDHPDASILCRSRVAQGRAGIRRAVVHQNNFKIRKGLGQKGIDAGIEIFFHPIHRHNDADLGAFRGQVCILLAHSAFSFRTGLRWYL